MKEKVLQRFAELTLAAYHIRFCHIPNVNVLRIGRNQFIPARGKSANNSWPDIMALGPLGRVLLMELKREGGVLSEGQEAFKAYCEQNRHAYTVCRNTDEIEAAVRALAGG